MVKVCRHIPARHTALDPTWPIARHDHGQGYRGPPRESILKRRPVLERPSQSPLVPIGTADGAYNVFVSTDRTHHRERERSRPSSSPIRTSLRRLSIGDPKSEAPLGAVFDGSWPLRQIDSADSHPHNPTPSPPGRNSIDSIRHLDRYSADGRDTAVSKSDAGHSGGFM